MAAGGRPGGPGRGRPRSPLCWKAIELFPLEPLGPATEGGGRITAPAQERGAQEQKGEASDVHGPAGPNGLTVSIQVRSGPFRSSNAPASRQTGSISDSGGRTTTTTARMADCRLQTAECRPQNRRTADHRTTGPQDHRAVDCSANHRLGAGVQTAFGRGGKGPQRAHAALGVRSIRRASACRTGGLPVAANQCQSVAAVSFKVSPVSAATQMRSPAVRRRWKTCADTPLTVRKEKKLNPSSSPGPAVWWSCRQTMTIRDSRAACQHPSTTQ